MKVTTAKLYKHCYGKYAIPAVNIAFMEQVIALFAAADRAGAPVIVQTTPLQRGYSSPAMLDAMVSAASQMYPDVIYAMHLDHGDIQHTHAAIAEGYYSSVMIDASHDPVATNISITKDIVEKAHAKGISVEAELGVLAGVEDNLTIAEESAFYTNPDDVERFVQETGCDSLAIAIGTSHGAYKFSGGQGLQFQILEEIQRRIPQFPLVLHGGSNVDPREIDRINAVGGALQSNAKGVDIEEVKQAIPLGICKINLATDFRILWTRIVREYFDRHPTEFMPIKIGREYMAAYEELMLEKFDAYSTIGQSVSLRSYLS